MKQLRYLAIVVFLFLITAATAVATTPYTRSDPQLYTIQIRYQVENRSSQPSTNITLTLPAIYPDSFSNQHVLASRWNRLPSQIVRDVQGNATATVIIPRLEAGARTEVVQEYLVSNFGIAFNLGVPAGPFPAPHPSYLQPEEKIESNHAEITGKASTVTAGKNTAEEKAQAIFAFVQQYMSYNPAYGNRGALSALYNRSGVCEDYAALFVALCRASGVPARLVSGHGSDQSSGSFVGHMWAEFFLPSYGWVPVEPTVVSQQVPWQYFAALPSAYRHIPFSLNSSRWQWSWQGGKVDVSANTTIRAGLFIPLFTDIQGHWAQKSIEELNLRGMIPSEQGLFKPSQALTRAEAAKLLVLARGLTPVYGASSFPDVKTGDLLHPYIQAAAQARLFGGFEDGTFRPNAPITREQLAVVLARSLGFNGGSLPQGAELQFADKASIASWALPGVTYSVGIKLFVGDEQNRFRPKDLCSRAEAAALIHRYINQYGQ